MPGSLFFPVLAFFISSDIVLTPFQSGIFQR
jgi:hypothetical protein